MSALTRAALRRFLMANTDVAFRCADGFSCPIAAFLKSTGATRPYVDTECYTRELHADILNEWAARYCANSSSWGHSMPDWAISFVEAFDEGFGYSGTGAQALGVLDGLELKEQRRKVTS